MLLKILANGIRYKKWVIPLTGILNNNDQTKIEIDKEMKSGFGVILDDIVAGIYSVIILLTIFIYINYV